MFETRDCLVIFEKIKFGGVFLLTNYDIIHLNKCSKVGMHSILQIIILILWKPESLLDSLQGSAIRSW